MPMERTNALTKTRPPVRYVGLAVAAICACLWHSTVATAQVSGSLKAFAGSWAGAGTLAHQNGETERINCRVDYVAHGSQGLQQSLHCRNDASNFDIVSNITAEGSRLRGDWTETNRGARGTLTGTISGGDIRADVQGQGFTAGVGIAVKGNRQSVTIRSAGTDISALSMTLTRAAR